MYFQTLEQLLHMEGHGAFVWAAYAITVFVIIAILLAPGRRQRRFLTQLAGELKRQQVADSNAGEN